MFGIVATLVKECVVLQPPIVPPLSSCSSLAAREVWNGALRVADLALQQEAAATLTYFWPFLAPRWGGHVWVSSHGRRTARYCRHSEPAVLRRWAPGSVVFDCASLAPDDMTLPFADAPLQHLRSCVASHATAVAMERHSCWQQLVSVPAIAPK
mmetsp:Transcript_50079/g.92396  ORF Transcript_50079/g.92396 Transcript_50079/m.92396 type:complete len:154 (-) Transcript_50079:224-685(-)